MISKSQVSELAKSLDEMVEAFRRADCTIQAVDIGGARAGGDIKPRASGENGLFILADQTAKRLFPYENPIGQKVGVESDVYTVIGQTKPRAAAAAIGGSLEAELATGEPVNVYEQKYRECAQGGQLPLPQGAPSDRVPPCLRTISNCIVPAYGVRWHAKHDTAFRGCWEREGRWEVG